MDAQPDAITMEQAAEDFAAEIAYWREVCGMAKKTLAAVMGFDPSYVSHMESGRHKPTEDFARRADEALNAGKVIWKRWCDYEAAKARTAKQMPPIRRRTEQPYATGSALIVEHDAARLDYDGSFYRLTMRRLLRNTGTEPITRYLIRISVASTTGTRSRRSGCCLRTSRAASRCIRASRCGSSTRTRWATISGDAGSNGPYGCPPNTWRSRSFSPRRSIRWCGAPRPR